MEKFKILIIMQAMNVGGVERALISLLSVIPQERYTVDLVLSKQTGDFLSRIPEYVNITEAPYRENIRSGEGIAEILTNLRADGKYITWLKLIIALTLNKLFGIDKTLIKVLYQYDTQNYDYLFNFTGVNTLTHLLSKHVYKANRKYIWVHGDSDEEEFVKYTNIYSVYDRVFCVSEKVTEKFKRFIPIMKEKTDTIYNEIDKTDMIKQADGGEGFIKYSNETIILTVGRLDVCKGYDIAINSCKKLLNDGFNVKWFVIGEGTERKKLEAEVKQKQIEDCFIMLGLKENPYPYYKSTDIYVQTSVSEGYCITLAEATAFNKPIVTTNFSGADEQITNGVNGYIVSMDANDIAEKIEILIENKDIRNGFSERLNSRRIGSSFEKLEQIMDSDRNNDISGG